MIIDGHLNLAYDALVNGRNHHQPLQQLRDSEKGRHPAGVATLTLPALQEAGIGLVLGTIFAQPAERRTAEVGWAFFVQHYSGLLLQVARTFASDYDEIQERYLYVCEKLAEHDFQRLGRFTHGGQTQFAAWLRAVARNLCIDYLRKQRGRRGA